MSLKLEKIGLDSYIVIHFKKIDCIATIPYVKDTYYHAIAESFDELIRHVNENENFTQHYTSVFSEIRYSQKTEWGSGTLYFTINNVEIKSFVDDIDLIAMRDFFQSLHNNEKNELRYFFHI